MAMPLRNSLSDYRYAYQGQEKDAETGKEAFQLRLWDARIGRWLTTDPYGQYASPYLGMGNNPVRMIDPDGGRADTFYKLKGTDKTVEVNDGIDKTIEVNASQFAEAMFFSNELGALTLYNTNTAGIRDAYYDFYNSVNNYDSLSLSSAIDYLFVNPYVELIGEPVIGITPDIGLGGGLKSTGRSLAKNLGKKLTIQKHHIIPKAIFKKYPVLGRYILRDGGFNLKKLPTPFHGNHPQYNKFVNNKIEQLIQNGNLNPKTLKSLQKNLNSLLNTAYDSGMKLNEYFRQFN